MLSSRVQFVLVLFIRPPHSHPRRHARSAKKGFVRCEFRETAGRETGQVEVYLIRLGERGGGDDVWTADACRYRIER